MFVRMSVAIGSATAAAVGPLMEDIREEREIGR